MKHPTVSEAQAARDLAYECQVDAQHDLMDAQNELMNADADLARAERALKEAKEYAIYNPPSWLESPG